MIIFIAQESQEKEIHLHETNPIALIKVLEYLYTKDLKVVGSMPIELIIDTFVLASHYQVEPLKYKLEIMLSLNITVENVCQLLLLANTYECVKVRLHCIPLVLLNNNTTNTYIVERRML